MTTTPPALLAPDLLGTFAFALDGALTALRLARLDVVGVITLGVITALGGGVVRDVLLGSLPPATVEDWRYPAVAAGSSPPSSAAGSTGCPGRSRCSTPRVWACSAVTGAGEALQLGLGPLQAVLLGAITGVGGGTLRDVLVGRVPTVLRSGAGGGRGVTGPRRLDGPRPTVRSSPPPAERRPARRRSRTGASRPRLVTGRCGTHRAAIGRHGTSSTCSSPRGARPARTTGAGQRRTWRRRGHDEGPPVVNKFVNDQVDIAKSLEAIANTMFEQGQTHEAVFTLLSALLAEVRAMRAEASQERNWVIDGIVNLQKTLS